MLQLYWTTLELYTLTRNLVPILMALRIHIEKILCYHQHLGSGIKVLRLSFWFKDLVWDNKFIRQMIMLITHHDEKYFFLPNLWLASTLFSVAIFCNLVKLVFKKYYSIKYSLSKKIQNLKYIYNHHVESIHCSSLSSLYIKIFSYIFYFGGWTI